MNVPQYLEANRTTLSELCRRSDLSYKHIHRHVKHGEPLGLDVARKLEQATGGIIKAAHVLGLDADESPEALALLRASSPNGSAAS